LCGICAYVEPAIWTSSIMSPRPRNGGSASSRAAASPQHADAGGADHLVAGERDEVGAEGRDVVRQLRDSLRRVDDDERTDLAGPGDDALDRVLGAQDVADVDERDDLGALGDQRVEVVEVEPALVGDGEPAQRRADPLGQQLPRHDVGVVLHLGDDDLVAGPDAVAAAGPGQHVRTRFSASRRSW
jgi:hypothetical protein